MSDDPERPCPPTGGTRDNRRRVPGGSVSSRPPWTPCRGSRRHPRRPGDGCGSADIPRGCRRLRGSATGEPSVPGLVLRGYLSSCSNCFPVRQFDENKVEEGFREGQIHGGASREARSLRPELSQPESSRYCMRRRVRLHSNVLSEENHESSSLFRVWWPGGRSVWRDGDSRAGARGSPDRRAGRGHEPPGPLGEAGPAH